MGSFDEVEDDLPKEASTKVPIGIDCLVIDPRNPRVSRWLVWWDAAMVLALCVRSPSINEPRLIRSSCPVLRTEP